MSASPRKALWFSAVFGLLGSILLGLYMYRFETKTSGGELVAVLVAVKEIARGEAITRDHVSVRRIPLAYVEDRALKDGELSKILGLHTRNVVKPQQTLFWTDLAVATEERDLSSLVRAGRRAVTIQATGWGHETEGELVRPGDYVDVIATLPQTGDRRSRTAVVLLQRALVLAVGVDTQRYHNLGPEAKTHARKKDKPLTLSLTLSEAQLLALASEQGRISVAVRSADDTTLLDSPPTIETDQLLGMIQTQELTTRSSNPHPQKIEAVDAPRR